jgi:membrane protein DedA with SNARE-associated domain
MFSFLIWIIIVILDIIAISNVLKSRHDNFTKTVLIVLILFFPFIGAGVYLLVFRDKGLG